MEVKSTRRFFNSEFIKENKLSFSAAIILQDIYRWIFSDSPPISFEKNGRRYFFISQTHIANFNDGLLSQQRISGIFKELKNIKIIEDSIVVDYHFNYVSFNWDIIKTTLLCKEVLKNMESNEWWKKIHDYADEQIAKEKEWNRTHKSESVYDTDYEIVIKNNRKYLVKKKNIEKSHDVNDVKLLSDEDMGIKSKICLEADRITKLILKKYSNYFSHKVPKEGIKPTKTYIEICNKITDIYNGTFIKSRFYPMGQKFLNNKQFNITDWKDKLKEVKGNWVKVKKLILSTLKNFELMHEENRLPYSKDYLQRNLNLWFYDKSSDYDNPQSQFVLCLYEPEFTNKHNSENKADKIFEKLPEKVKIGGNRLFELNENMPAGSFWQKVEEIFNWAKYAFEYEPNITYWITSPTEIPNEFARYCEEKEISVSVNTLNIKRAVENNSPWTWFVKDMSIKHGLNSHLSELVTEDDFKKLYKNTSRITDGISEIIF